MQLFAQTPLRLRALARGAPGAVAIIQARLAELGQMAHRARILRPRVAVAKVAAEVEAQRLGQVERLAYRVRMIGEAAGHRLRRAQHVAVVATPQRLGCLERGAQAQRHERVLQLRARAGMRVYVAGGHACHPQPPGERGQRPVAGAVVAGVGALQLDPQSIRAEGVEQPPRGRLVVHAMLGTSAQAEEAL